MVGIPSQIRSSTVPKLGWGRMSHQISRMELMARAEMRVVISSENPSQPSARVASRSARASPTVEQMPVTSSMFDSMSSFLAFGCGSPRSFSSRRRISLAPLRSSREPRSTMPSSTSTPRDDPAEALKTMSTDRAYQRGALLKTASGVRGLPPESTAVLHCRNIEVTGAKQPVVNLTRGLAPTRGRVRMEGNTAWVLASAALVLFMTPGLALFYGGMVRSKNVLGMLMQNFFCMGLVSVIWAALTYSLAFSGDNKWLGNLDLAWLRDAATTSPTGLPLTIPPLAFMAFQLLFAIITPALITGAIADRMRFSGWVWFVALWAILVYAPIAHWAFSPAGWLFKRGALDFAGGTVVHINAGIAAL